MQLLSGRAHPKLAADMAEALGTTLSPVRLEDFANGEIRCIIEESVRGNDVFIIQSHQSFNTKIHKSIFEQLLMIDAAKRASARTITAVCPFLSYARQDRKASGREPIGARLMIDMLTAAGADRIMSVDLHSGQTQGFFDGPFDHLISMPLFKQYLQTNFDSNIVMVSPDAGRVKLNERYSSALGCDIAIIHKQRSTEENNSSEARQLIGDVAGKTCIIVDDMIDTAGTVCAAADMLKEHGAGDIYGLATHGILSSPAVERIEASAFKKIIVTDTLPVNIEGTNKIEVLSVAPLIADAINAVCTGQSISALFEGQNQI